MLASPKRPDTAARSEDRARARSTRDMEESTETVPSGKVAISADLRRNIIGTATPFRQQAACEVHHIVGSANFHEEAEGSVVKLHPLCRLAPRDAGWRECLPGVACFHCCEPFDTDPVWIPDNLNESNVYEVLPMVFCSLSCAKAHLIDKNAFDCTVQMMLLHRVARDVYGFVGGDITPAPPRECLCRFGGDLAIEAFRAKSDVATCKIDRPPFVPVSTFVECRMHQGELGGSPGESATVIRREVPSTDAAPNNWRVRDLRRPAVAHTLPRAADSAADGESMLEQFSRVRDARQEWDASKFDVPRVVTSQTPSVQQVKDAENAGRKTEELVGPPPSSSKRVVGTETTKRKKNAKKSEPPAARVEGRGGALARFMA